MKRFAIMALAALSLTACRAGIDPANNAGAIVETACEITLQAKYDTEAAYNAVATAYVAADEKNVMSAEIKGKAKAALVNAWDWIGKAREAYKLRDATGFCPAINAASREVNAARNYVPRLPE